MSDPHPDLTSSVIAGLGWYYLLMFLLNIAWTVRSYKLGTHKRIPKILGGYDIPSASIWAVYSAMLGIAAFAHIAGTKSPEDFILRAPLIYKNFADWILADAVAFFTLTIVLFVLMVWRRRDWATPTAGWVMLNASMLFMGISLTDWDFRQIVGKPDNVPIVAMLYILGVFTWIYFRRANDNDQRIAEGRPLYEVENKEKILVWPDLVYTELICMVLVTVVLVAWGLLLQAPLEEPANAAKTPNPSKAPWYFLGLQEMLVYFDPWLAGVVFPSVILVGLMALPYIDFNKKGNGYYCYNDRRFAVNVFLFGFFPLWTAMIILGTFLRGPNWNLFGIYEYWDVHKLEALNNVNLSEYFWIHGLGQSLPEVPKEAGLFQFLMIGLREAPGLIAVVFYLFVLPPILALIPYFRTYFVRMGFLRFMVFSNLLLLMAALPIKMVLRWTIHLKYIVAIPEYLINI